MVTRPRYGGCINSHLAQSCCLFWYTWRYQMTCVAEAGYRAIAIDFRGYGLSDPKAEPEKTTYADVLSDLLALLDALGLDKVILIAKDFGAFPAYLFTLLHPTRVSGVITLGIVFSPPGPRTFLKLLPEGFYINRWQVPGRAEADFARFDAKTVVRNIYILFSKSELPIAPENQEIMDLVEPSTPLPPWFTEDDLAVYGSLYEKSGFCTALKVPYRCHVIWHANLSCNLACNSSVASFCNTSHLVVPVSKTMRVYLNLVNKRICLDGFEQGRQSFPDLCTLVQS